MKKEPETFLTTTQARERMGVSKGKMTSMIKDKEILTYPDPRNKRVKLIKQSDVDAWLARAVRPPTTYRKREETPTGQEEGANKDRPAAQQELSSGVVVASTAQIAA
jgi:excisionase family DNA binding protein